MDAGDSHSRHKNCDTLQVYMEMIFLIVALVCLIAISIATPVVFLLEVIGWAWTGVPFVPVPKSAMKKLPEVMDLGNGAVVYDLGCGDGRVLYMLAEQSDATFIGVEKAPLPYLAAKLREKSAPRKNVKIIFGDIFKVPLGDATHVYTYLLSRVMDKLLPKFEKELKPGTTVVSCDFKFSKKPYEKSVDAPEGKTKHTLYFYRF